MKYLKISSFYAFFFYCSFLQAQVNLLPLESSTLPSKSVFCSPGVINASRSRGAEFTHGIHSPFALQVPVGIADGSTSGQVTFVESYKAKLKIPLVIKQDFKLLFGYEYNSETYHFGETAGFHSATFNSLDNKALRSNRYSLYATKSFNERVYSLIRLRATYNGDYDQGMTINDRYGIYSVIGGVGFKESDKKEWGLGVSYSYSKFRTRLIPFLLYNQTFNNKWGVEAILPLQIFARYNVSKKTILLSGIDYHSTFYNADFSNAFSNELENYYIKQSGLRSSITLEQHIAPWLWMHAKTGYQTSFTTDFQNQDDSTASFGANTGNTWFFQIGLFLSPPDKLMNR